MFDLALYPFFKDLNSTIEPHNGALDPYTLRPVSTYRREQDQTVYEVELPGVSAENLSISIEDGVCRLKGFRKIHGRTETINHTFAISKKMDVEKVTAELQDGILILTIPDQPKQTKQIPIRTSKPTS